VTTSAQCENDGVTYTHLIVETDGPFTTITLNRPEKRNALALDVMLELTQAFRDVGASNATGVILAANGPVFSAGHNFGDMAGATFEQAKHLFDVCTEMMDTVQSIPQVVIARVHALATAAGCQLVATCDLAVAANSAGFAIPGGKGGLTVRRPHSSPLVRQQRPTSPILRFVKDVERDGRLSTRYDSPAVALHAAQPELPPRLGVPDIRPDVAVRYDLFGAQVPEI
jgi:hypothetical protein